MWKHNHTTIVIAADTHVYIKGKHTEHIWYEDTQGNRQKRTKIKYKYHCKHRNMYQIQYVSEKIFKQQQQNMLLYCVWICEFVNTCAMVYHTHKQHQNVPFLVVSLNQHTLAWVSCENVWEGNNVFTVCTATKKDKKYDCNWESPGWW